jgi:hypothetical protein
MKKVKINDLAMAKVTSQLLRVAHELKQEAGGPTQDRLRHG